MNCNTQKTKHTGKIALTAVILIALLTVLTICLSGVAHAETTSGTCGDNLTWTLNDEGTLTISGSGDMTDYTWNGSPWYNNRIKIRTVVIENGVTSVGVYAFYYCTSLTNIDIPDSVTSIGSDAVTGCSSLVSITVGANNAVYKSEGNCIIEKSTNTLIIGCKTSVIPSSVTSIGNKAFTYCISLTSIDIPDSVISIGSDAFNNCTSLTSVTIPNSVTDIGGYAFSNCASLASIDISDSVTSIGNKAFYNCSSLTGIIVGANNTVYKSDGNCIIEKSTNTLILGCNSSIIPSYAISIGGSAFSGSNSLTSITIPDGVKTIGNNAFYDCASLTSVTIPESVTSIGRYAFFYCSKLTSVTISGSDTSIGNSAFSGCASLTIYGYAGSTAQTYATNNSVPFVPVEEIVPVTGKYAAYVSTRNGTAADTHDIRFIIAANLAALLQTETGTVKITFMNGETEVKSLTRTLGGNKNDFTLYSLVTAGGVAYKTSGDNEALFGLIVTGVPDSAWTRVTLTITDENNSVDYSGHIDN